MRRQREAEIQRQCVEWFRKAFPAEVLIYINNNSSSPRAGHRNKLLGTFAGFPDLFLYHKTKSFAGLAIEMKAPGGKCSAKQLQVHDQLTQQGYLVAVISSLESFKALVTDYLGGKLKKERK